MNEQTLGKPPSGTPADSRGTATVDPTANVLQLVDAAVKRIDDLRNADYQLINRLLEDEKAHIREVLNLRSEYTKELGIAEAKRIDAIRAVDVGAVAVAAERQVAAAGVLANQVATSADQLRALVQTQAVTVATAQQQLIEPIMTRLAAMERTQYEGLGKERVADPQAAAMAAELRTMRQEMALGSGMKQGAGETKVEGRDQTRLVLALIAGFIGFFGFLLTIAGFVFALTR